VRVQGVTCTLTSSAPAVATVDPNTGSVAALSVGTTAITATCRGVTNTVTITVRPRLVQLTLNSAGDGAGSILASPPNGTGYDEGTTVTITATANNGSTFTGFSGDCTGTTNPCTLLLNGNKTVTANFVAFELFRNTASFGGAMSPVYDPSPPGCTYNVAANITTLEIRVTSASTTGTDVTDISITPTGGNCTGNPFTDNGAGTLTVSGSNINGTLQNTSGRHKVIVSATRNGNTITGTARVEQVLVNGQGTQFPTSGGPYSFTLSRVP
jgi:List-Bact-rpt repeat protein/Big-like domain-containing protein